MWQCVMELKLAIGSNLQVAQLKASNSNLVQDKAELQEQISTAEGKFRDDDSAEGDEGAFHTVGDGMELSSRQPSG
jgi:hypothetical protein